MKSIIPCIMAGVIGIYGLIIAILIGQGGTSFVRNVAFFLSSSGRRGTVLHFCCANDDVLWLSIPHFPHLVVATLFQPRHSVLTSRVFS